MTDEQDKQQPVPAEPAGDIEPGEAERPEEEHSFKESARETVAKVVGRAVELGSILGGEGGEIVEAQRQVAEAEAEEFIDRIDGED